MKRSALSILILAALLAPKAFAAEEEVKSRGVNPADIDNRVDLIAKQVGVKGGGTVTTLTGKYDQKLSSGFGLNFELPMYMDMSTPGLSSSGTGDLYARGRYITQVGAWAIGASLETVLPVATSDALGTGKYQLNVAGLAVRPWSARFMTAFAIKQNSSVGGDSNRANISTTELRFLPIFVLPHAWAVVGEYRHVYSHTGNNPQWSLAEVSLNKQLDLNWAVSVSASRQFGDQADRGGVGASVKYFF